MAKYDILIVEGRAYSWQQLCELRRLQVEARHGSRNAQLTLFDMQDDCRPAAERTAAGRYQEPTLFNPRTR